MTEGEQPQRDDGMVTRVAGALYKHAVDQARKDAVAYDLQIERLKTTFQAACSESDRSSAILVFALAEDLMLSALKEHLDGDAVGGWKELTRSNGFLSSANDRLTLLAMLHWIRPETLSDMKLLKSIRNEFAHQPNVTSFGDQRILGYISSMKQREQILKVAREAGKDVPEKYSPRKLYLMRACSTVAQLMFDLAVGPSAKKHRVNPRDVEGRTYDEVPDELKAAVRLQAEMMLTISEM